MTQRFAVDYPTPERFIDAVEQEVVHGGLLVRAVQATPGDPECVVEVRLQGELIAEVKGHIGAVARSSVAVSFDPIPEELIAYATRLQHPADEAEEEPAPEPNEPVRRGTISDRLAALTVGQKTALALSGDRETRMALLRDHNKMLHAFVLRNPRIGLDEVLYAAKLATLAPDALKFLSEHPEWGQNSQVWTALVRNQKTPMPVALKLLPRLSQNEIRAIAKGNARDQLVFAARRMLSGGV
jgi:hypothetical protein